MQLGGTVMFIFATAIKTVGQHGGFHKSGDAPIIFNGQKSKFMQIHDLLEDVIAQWINEYL